MKKLFLILLAFCCLSCTGARGENLKTVSSFAGEDASAGAYTQLLMAWEEKTGNTVSDHSSTSDEAWKQGVLMDFAAGNEPDVLFFFTCTADSAYLLNRVVPIREINQAYPDLNIPENPACEETDGQIYAVPVRSFWEGLFCNVDLFEQYQLELPYTWELLEKAISVFRQNGIVPISVSFSDVPHYMAEFAILACGSPEDYQKRPTSMDELPQSWIKGMALIRRLYELGAFADNVNATNENEASQLFRHKKAAMQADGSWFANSLPEENMATTLVLPFPSYQNIQDPLPVIGGVSMGFYLSRRAWHREDIRDKAVDLLAFLSTGENARLLGGFQFSGKMLESAYQLTTHPLYAPIQDQMSQEARSEWFRLIPEVAAGEISPQTLWERVMALNPFLAP